MPAGADIKICSWGLVFLWGHLGTGQLRGQRGEEAFLDKHESRFHSEKDVRSLVHLVPDSGLLSGSIVPECWLNWIISQFPHLLRGEGKSIFFTGTFI